MGLIDMIARHDIIQGTPEWHEARWAKVGGKRLNQLLIRSESLFNRMLGEYTEPYVYKEGFTNAAMERGNELEPEAIYELMQYTGVTVQSVGWLQSTECPILGISPDAISEDETVCFETKCPDIDRHILNCLSKTVQKDDLPQCVQYFVVNPKLETLYYASYRPEALKPLKVFKLTRDTEVNLGWTKKIKVEEDRGKGLKEYIETVADERSIAEWVKVALIEGEALNKRMNEGVELLKF